MAGFHKIRMYYGNPQIVDDLPNILGVYCRDAKKDLLTMHQALTKHGAWKDLAEIKSTTDLIRLALTENIPWMQTVEKDKLVVDQGHSTTSLLNCWAICRFIATEGWAKFCEINTPSS